MTEHPATRSDQASAWAATAVFLALCLGPYATRLAWPSLYADDVARVEQLQTVPPGALLFLPFNEHLAPLFQGISWVTWRLAGGSLARSALAFTVASYVPFLLTLPVLAGLVRRETGSRAAALAGVAVFSLSWLAIETVYWYSASSFEWALLATLLAWLGASGVRSDGGSAVRVRGWLLAAGAAAAAPAFSAVGLLAGPFGAVRGASGPGRGNLRARAVAASAPVLGTLAYLTLAAGFRYHAVVGSSLERNANFGPGVAAALRAPAEVLIPALAGFQWGPLSGWRAGVSLALGAAGLAALLGLAFRRADLRPGLLGGLGLVFGGYALAFCARPDGPGHSALNTQRYHLFPMAGLVLLLAPLLRRGLGRWDARPASAAWAASAVALVLLGLHAREMKGRARFMRHPDQTRTLAALDRLGVSCRRLGVSRARALAALDPIETEWTPPGYSALVMLPETGPDADPGRSPDTIKAALLAALSPDDRRGVCGGMDATPYLHPGPVGGASEGKVLAEGRPLRRFRVEAGPGGVWRAAGWPSFVEFALDGGDCAQARALAIPAGVPAGLAEVWWRGERGRWTETRSVRLRLEPRAGSPGWVLPLDRLPHWDPSESSRVRLLFHEPGPVAATPPRLLR